MAQDHDGVQAEKTEVGDAAHALPDIGLSLSEHDPYNNIVRTAIEAMAAVFGGTQSLHTNSFDEAMALPTDFSARIARNTQVILQEETNITRVIDPWAGSYLMEKLTQDMADQAWTIIEEVEAMGGMTKAVSSGWAKLRIEQCSAEKQARIDRGDDVIVGVNKYRLTEEEPIDIREIDNAAVREAQLRRLSELRARRDGKAVAAALDALTDAARSEQGNLLDLSIKATRARNIEAGCFWTGEIRGPIPRADESVSGVYGAMFESDAPWQSLKGEIERFAAEEGRRPRLMVAKLGQDGHDRGAKIIATAFPISASTSTSARCSRRQRGSPQAVENDVHVVGVSTLAAGHKTLVPQLIAALREQGAEDVLVVVGGVVPAQDYEFLHSAGAAAVFGPGTVITEAARQIIAAVRAVRTRLAA
jgi:methylmalonyl-CoA mutase